MKKSTPFWRKREEERLLERRINNTGKVGNAESVIQTLIHLIAERRFWQRKYKILIEKNKNLLKKIKKMDDGPIDNPRGSTRPPSSSSSSSSLSDISSTSINN